MPTRSNPAHRPWFAPARPAPVREDLELEHEGARYRCRLLPSRRNRHLRLSILWESPLAGALSNSSRRTCVSLGGSAQPEPCGFLPGFETVSACVLRVTYPPRLSRARVLETVRSHIPWVKKQLARRNPAPGLGRQALVTGAKLLFQGNPLALVVLPSERVRPWVRLEGDRLLCSLRDTRQAAVKQAVERWYRAQAQTLLDRRLSELAPGITVQPFAMAVRAQKSRWGSCSANRKLSLNWKLVLMPEFALNYVLIHELAHLEELNHSARFWNLVESHCSYWRSAKKWLQKHGPELDW